MFQGDDLGSRHFLLRSIPSTTRPDLVCTLYETSTTFVLVSFLNLGSSAVTHAVSQGSPSPPTSTGSPTNRLRSVQNSGRRFKVGECQTPGVKIALAHCSLRHEQHSSTKCHHSRYYNNHFSVFFKSPGILQSTTKAEKIHRDFETPGGLVSRS